MSAADWTVQASWMRANGATAAAWHPDGSLSHLSLGPMPASQPVTDDLSTQPSTTQSPQERERRERIERRDIALRASGGPVLRLDAEHL